MDSDDIIQLFESRSASGDSLKLSHAAIGFAAWIANRRQSLSEEDFALLIEIGAALYQAGLQQHLAAPDDEMESRLLYDEMRESLRKKRARE